MKLLTLLYLRRSDELLLALKKRGFGEGRWNGVGGKVEPGETVRAAAIRECQEEIGVEAVDLALVGRLTFYDKADPGLCHHTAVYVTTQWHGDPVETEEMQPRWYKETDLPYDDMWPDDRVWLPVLLQGKQFEGSFTVDGNHLANYQLQVVDSLTEPSAS